MQCQRLKTYMETGRVIFLPARAIRPNPEQPRKVFEEQALEELAQSIRQHGILQPLSVRRMGTGYELIAGERRLRAAQRAGLTEIPCILVKMDDTEAGAAAMVENLQRQDLDYIEEALGLARMMELGNLSQEQAAKRIGKSQSAVANKLRLLRHSREVLEALRSGGLSERHARALLKLPEEQKLKAIAEITRRHMTVAQTERYVDELLRSAPKKQPQTNLTALLNRMNAALTNFGAVCERRETEEEIVLTVRIPKEMKKKEGSIKLVNSEW